MSNQKDLCSHMISLKAPCRYLEEKRNNNFEKYKIGMNSDKDNIEETLFIHREKFRQK